MQQRVRYVMKRAGSYSVLNSNTRSSDIVSNKKLALFLFRRYVGSSEGRFENLIDFRKELSVREDLRAVSI